VLLYDRYDNDKTDISYGKSGITITIIIKN
jgi:hypothetical protein